MFASHFTRIKQVKRGTGSVDAQNHNKGKDDKEPSPASSVVVPSPPSPLKNEGQDSSSAAQNKPKSRKRRRKERNDTPRRTRPTPQALNLSRQLQDLARHRRLPEMLHLFWSEENTTIRDNHHACIIVDCCSKCGDVTTAEKIVQSLPTDLVTVEVHTALLKCYAHAGNMGKALSLFGEMCRSKHHHQRPNVRTLNTLLRGCLWTASTTVKGFAGDESRIVGGVVSSEQAWALYQSIRKGESNAVDTSSYEASIILLTQALRLEDAKARIAQLQSQYHIKCKGTASIKGGDQSSLETCGIAYLSLARAYAIMGQSQDMWIAGQRCLHAIQSSKAKLDQGNDMGQEESSKSGGKRSWKVDTSDDGQKRMASNLAYRRHRLDEVETEARALLKLRHSRDRYSIDSLGDRLHNKLLYFSGGGTVSTSLSKTQTMAPQSFGLEAVEAVKGGADDPRRRVAPLTRNGHLDISKIFAPPLHKNPIDIELGSGYGDWIVRQARAFADRNHVAVELRADRVYQIFARGTLTGETGLPNLCTIGCESGVFLRNHIPQGTIASVFANHPEPPTQILGQNWVQLEDIMSGGAEPTHMISSATLEGAAAVLVPRGRLVIVTDNRHYGNLVCATLVRLLRQHQGLLHCLDESKAQKMKLTPVERFPQDIVLYEGVPSLQLGHARDDRLTGQSYFDRLWKTGAGSHAETTRRFIIAMYKK